MKKTINRYYCDLCEDEIHDTSRHQFDINLTFNTYKMSKREVVTIQHLCGVCETGILNSIENCKKHKKK